MSSSKQNSVDEQPDLPVECTNEAAPSSSHVTTSPKGGDAIGGDDSTAGTVKLEGEK